MARKTTRLERWIQEFGAERLAKNLKISRQAVRHWEDGTCLPRTHQMPVIRKLSKGKITYNAIIDRL